MVHSLKVRKASITYKHQVARATHDREGSAHGWSELTFIIKHYNQGNMSKYIHNLTCGPPGQVAALAGKKDGYKQGALSGVLKELGYTEDQVFKF